MSTLDLSKDSKRRPTELVSDVALSDDAVAMLGEASNTHSYLGMLSENELFNDAFLTLARTLPKQYAIIWASRCVKETVGDQISDDEKQCVEITHRWLNGPDDELRRAAMDAADRCNYEGPCAWLAAAVAFSGGSLAPRNQADVPPPGHLTAVAVAACLLSLSALEPDTMAESSRKMIQQGLALVAIPGSESEQ